MELHDKLLLQCRLNKSMIKKLSSAGVLNFFHLCYYLNSLELDEYPLGLNYPRYKNPDLVNLCNGGIGMNGTTIMPKSVRH